MTYKSNRPLRKDRAQDCETPDFLQSAVAMLAAMPDAIILLDMQGRINWANPAAEFLFGFAWNEIRNLPASDFLPSSLNIASLLQTDTEPGFNTIEFHPDDGAKLWLHPFRKVLDKRAAADHAILLTFRDVTEQHRHQKAHQIVQNQLICAAYHDELTGLANRKKLDEFLGSDAIRAELVKKSIGLLLIDLDEFKEVNDTLGHAAGDATLIHVANAMQRECGPDDLICRTGGDEFLMICRNIAGRAALLNRADRLLRTIQTALLWQDQTIRVRASVGAALPGNAGPSGADLIRRADMALYSAKKHGRGQVAFYTSALGRLNKARQILARDIKAALDNQQFEIYVQPHFCTLKNRVTGCEALLRWNHPSQGILLPGDYFDTAERTAHFTDINLHATTLALDALRCVHDAGHTEMCMTINLAADILTDTRYPALLNWEIQTRNIAPHKICLDIEETTFIENGGPNIVMALEQLKNLGVRVALDNFGTGYAGLLHITNFKIDTVKLGRDMIRGLENDPRKQLILKSLIRLCGQLDIIPFTCGVETRAQVDFLNRIGTPAIQGHAIARPMPVGDLLNWLEEPVKLQVD